MQSKVLYNKGNVEFKITFTTRCSAACTTCLNKEIKNHYEIERDLFEKIIYQIIELNLKQNVTVSFYSIGESYLYPQYIDCCEWAIPILHDKNIKTVIVTNGTHVDRIPKGIDEFIISFNAGKKESYEKITNASFDNTYKNIKRLYETGEFRKAKNPQIHMLCFDANKGEEKYFLDLFHGFKGVKYRFSYKYDNQFNKSNHQGRGEQYENRYRKPCVYVTNKTVIYPNGDIVRCSHDFFDATSYGNLKEKSLKEILLCGERQSQLQKHNNGVFEDICKDCDFNCTSEEMEYFVYGMFDKWENVGFQTKQMIYRKCRKIKRKIKKFYEKFA